MLTVCAWCQRYMGSREPFPDPSVSHGICDSCVEQQQSLASTPVLVVSRARVDALPSIRTLFRGMTAVSLVVDRRAGERRSGNGAGTSPAERRRGERRRSAAPYVV